MVKKLEVYCFAQLYYLSVWHNSLCLRNISKTILYTSEYDFLKPK